MKKAFLALIAGTSLAMVSTSALAATYTVQANDTLWKISQNENVSLSSLEGANPNVNPMSLYVGQTINLPSNAQSAVHHSTYTVQTGDTFWTISKRYNISLNSLIASNPGVTQNNLQIGEIIRLPQSSMSISSTTASQPTNYSKVLNVVATAYTAAPNENGGYGAVDYFGNPLKFGTIAVDPSVIPLNSTVYITGPGIPNGGMIGHATDEGGAIKGNRIDIFMNSIQSADNFGMQNVKVYFLK